MMPLRRDDGRHIGFLKILRDRTEQRAADEKQSLLINELNHRVKNTSDIIRLRWEEKDGPRVTPPSRRGFGSRLIERSLSAALGGEAAIGFAPSGVVCMIAAAIPPSIGAHDVAVIA
jgi:two-component sensor histidine kinase